MLNNIERQRVLKFLADIGLEFRLVDEANNGFINHIQIKNGVLLIDPYSPAPDILHEAGHLAVTPSRWRRLASGNMADVHRLMFYDLNEMNLHPDHPLSRAAINSGDVEATAWAWAAGKHIGLEDHEIIVFNDPSAYNGDGKGIAFMLHSCTYFGIHGLQHAGFCRAGNFGYKHLPKYPELAFWLQQ
jgi:hypothetical protein